MECLKTTNATSARRLVSLLEPRQEDRGTPQLPVSCLNSKVSSDRVPEEQTIRNRAIAETAYVKWVFHSLIQHPEK